MICPYVPHKKHQRGVCAVIFVVQDPSNNIPCRLCDVSYFTEFTERSQVSSCFNILIIISNKIVIIITEHELAYTPMERCIEWRNNVECGAVCTVDENHVDNVLKVCRHRYLDQKPLQRAFTETY